MPCLAVCVEVARSLLYLWRNLQVYYDLGYELPSAQLYLSSKSKQQTHICLTNTAQSVKILYHFTQSVPVVVVVRGSVLVPVLPVLGLEGWNHLTLHQGGHYCSNQCLVSLMLPCEVLFMTAFSFQLQVQMTGREEKREKSKRTASKRSSGSPNRSANGAGSKVAVSSKVGVGNTRFRRLRVRSTIRLIP